MAWTAPEERFGRVDTLVSKKRIDQFPVIVKETSGQMRQYQEVVSELIGDFKEHKFTNLTHKFLKNVSRNSLYAFAVDGLNLLKGSQNYQPGVRLQVGWKKRQKSLNPNSGGCCKVPSSSVD